MDTFWQLKGPWLQRTRTKTGSGPVPDQHWITSIWEETEANCVANEAAYKMREGERLREMARNQQNGRDECDLIGRVGQWHAQCPICHTYKNIGYEVDADHLLEECRHPKQAIVAKEIAVLKGLKLASSTGCPKCALPFYDCDNCIYSGVMHSAIAGMMIVGPTVVFNKMTAWMMIEGISVEAKEKELSLHEKGHLRVLMLDWFSQRVRWGDSGVSVLVPVFNRLDRWTEAFRNGTELEDWI